MFFLFGKKNAENEKNNKKIKKFQLDFQNSA
jgi:hypothetical protein